MDKINIREDRHGSIVVAPKDNSQDKTKRAFFTGVATIAGFSLLRNILHKIV